MYAIRSYYGRFPGGYLLQTVFTRSVIKPGLMPIRLSQIIFNLMSNSLKFTQNGQVTIKAKLERQDYKTLFIQFTVEDNGIGIPEKYQTKVFEKFVQIDRKDSYNFV